MRGVPQHPCLGIPRGRGDAVLLGWLRGEGLVRPGHAAAAQGGSHHAGWNAASVGFGTIVRIGKVIRRREQEGVTD